MQHSSVRYRLLHGRPDLRESRMFGFKMFGRYILIIKYWTVFCVLFTGMRYVYVYIYKKEILDKKYQMEYEYDPPRVTLNSSHMRYDSIFLLANLSLILSHYMLMSHRKLCLSTM